ncbi:MAG TPA: Gfo/Idh/MocA family oxidoreductase [Polyangiaceae bacterium]|nr:Gfo/Idh/MocA family oxidoreductase [Polyangiaceae bacterium]
MSVFGFGVIGTGQIARAFVAALAESQRCRVVHVLGSTPAKGHAFAEQFGVARSAERVETLLEDPSVHGVYVAVPHPLHERFTSQALAHGKHVLCEKPLTLDSRAAERLIAQARSARVILMEAFMYRCHPVIPALLDELQSGSIGMPRRLESDFCFEAPYDPTGRLFCKELGGGAIWDVGGYPISLARLIAGTLEARPYAEPELVQVEGEVGPSGVDVFASAELRFASGFTARARCATRRALGNRSVIMGDAGQIEVPDLWLPGGERLGKTQGFVVRGSVGDASARAVPPIRTVQVSAALAPFALEAERLLDAVELGEVPFPALDAGDTLGNLRTLEAWLAALAH